MAVESEIQSILLVEESATLRYILVKILQKQGFEIQVLDSFDAAYETLEQADNSFQALIIGWPNYDQHKDVDRLVKLAEKEKYSELPVLVLSHDAQIDVLNWMSRRRFTALIPWENYQESVATLQKLIGPEMVQEHRHPVSSLENPIRILFVDDSVSIRHYYQRLLNRNGYIT